MLRTKPHYKPHSKPHTCSKKRPSIISKHYLISSPQFPPKLHSTTTSISRFSTTCAENDQGSLQFIAEPSFAPTSTIKKIKPTSQPKDAMSTYNHYSITNLNKLDGGVQSFQILFAQKSGFFRGDYKLLDEAGHIHIFSLKKVLDVDNGKSLIAKIYELIGPGSDNIGIFPGIFSQSVGRDEKSVFLAHLEIDTGSGNAGGLPEEKIAQYLRAFVPIHKVYKKSKFVYKIKLYHEVDFNRLNSTLMRNPHLNRIYDRINDSEVHFTLRAWEEGRPKSISKKELKKQSTKKLSVEDQYLF